MKPEYIAIIISLGAFIVASLSLGWNIYRDIMLKPKLKVSYRIMHGAGGRIHGKDMIIVNATNFGPTKTKLELIVFDQASLWKRIRRKKDHGFVMHDYLNPDSWKLPCWLEVGETASYLFPVCEETNWATRFNRMGISDAFGKTHWSSRNEGKEVKRKFNELIKK